MFLGTLEPDNFMLGDLQVDKIMIGDIKVWTHVVIPPYVGPPSPLKFTNDVTLIAGTDFPAGIQINVCLIGGGGSGCVIDINGGDKDGGGGFSGDITSVQHTFIYNEPYQFISGLGGTAKTSLGSGNSGQESTFGTFTALGGSGGVKDGDYQGSDDTRTTCAGTADDGDYYNSTYHTYGGQSSGATDGSNGQPFSNSENSTEGSGTGCSGDGSGTGGSGILILSW